MSDDNYIKEKEANQESYVLELRNALKNKSIGEGIEFDDAFLIKFLRSRSYKIDEVCELIKRYISLFKKYPNFFEGVDSLKRLYEAGMFYVIGDGKKDGERICFLCPGVLPPWDKFAQEVVQTTVYGYELAELEESVQINGAIEVLDCAGIGIRHFWKVGIAEIMLGVDMTEKSLPIRWRKIIVVNENSFVDVCWSIAKTFMSKQMRETFLFVGSDMKKLHEFISPELLPSKYGGTSQCDPVEYFKYLKSNESALMSLWQPFKSFHQNAAK